MIWWGNDPDYYEEVVTTNTRLDDSDATRMAGAVAEAAFNMALNANEMLADFIETWQATQPELKLEDRVNIEAYRQVASGHLESVKRLLRRP